MNFWMDCSAHRYLGSQRLDANAYLCVCGCVGLCARVRVRLLSPSLSFTLAENASTPTSICAFICVCPCDSVHARARVCVHLYARVRACLCVGVHVAVRQHSAHKAHTQRTQPDIHDTPIRTHPPTHPLTHA